MYAEIGLKIASILIDRLVQSQEERKEIKRQLMLATAKYHDGVLDSSILRREWDELTQAFDTPQKG